jgi:hypothetical protein
MKQQHDQSNYNPGMWPQIHICVSPSRHILLQNPCILLLDQTKLRAIRNSSLQYSTISSKIPQKFQTKLNNGSYTNSNACVLKKQNPACRSLSPNSKWDKPITNSPWNSSMIKATTTQTLRQTCAPKCTSVFLLAGILVTHFFPLQNTCIPLPDQTKTCQTKLRAVRNWSPHYSDGFI